MTLLEIAPGLLSLEFAAGEAETIKQRLRKLGAVSVQRHATYDLVKVAGEEFVQENEWDGPCLIARSAAGSALLQYVASLDSEPTRLAS